MTGQEQAKSERAADRAERRVWAPELVDESQANVRVLTSTPDAAAAQLSVALVEIAERALGERPAAEGIVANILRSESQLVATATRAASPPQREAAQLALSSMVRRAVLDALPPVVPSSSKGQAAATAPTGGAEARKVRAVQPGDAAKPVSAGARGGSKLIAVVAVALLLLGGLAAWHFLLRPSPDAAMPLAVGSADGQPPLADEPDVLQLEAPEPASGPLREARPGEPASALPPIEPPPAAPSEMPPPRRIDMAPTARAAAALQPSAAAPPTGLELPAGAPDLRVFILYPEGETAAAEASDLYGALSNSGSLPLVVLRDVTFEIASPRIRYFHDEDAAAARTLADFLEVPANGSGAWEVQNFTHISPLPAPGTLEVYVPSP